MATFLDSVMATDNISNLALTSAAGSYVVPASGHNAWTLVEIAVTQNAFLHYTTTATSTNGEYWPAGMVKVKKIPVGTTVSFIRDATDGRITFSVQV